MTKLWFNKKYVFNALAALATAYVAMPVYFTHSEKNRFTNCLLDEGIVGHMVTESAVSRVILVHKGETEHPLSYNFFCTGSSPCDPFLMLGKKKIPKERMTEQQRAVLKGVDTCRRQGLLASTYRKLGLLSAK